MTFGAGIRLLCMADIGGSPHAVIRLVAGDRRLVLGTLRATGRCDLALVDAILHLQLIARRRRTSIELDRVGDDLAELLDLVGVRDRLNPAP